MKVGCMRSPGWQQAVGSKGAVWQYLSSCKIANVVVIAAVAAAAAATCKVQLTRHTQQYPGQRLVDALHNIWRLLAP